MGEKTFFFLFSHSRTFPFLEVARGEKVVGKMDGDQKVKLENNDVGVGGDHMTITVIQQGQSRTNFACKVYVLSSGTFVREPCLRFGNVCSVESGRD